jgi:hypothetical protein
MSPETLACREGEPPEIISPGHQGMVYSHVLSVVLSCLVLSCLALPCLALSCDCLVLPSVPIRSLPLPSLSPIWSCRVLSRSVSWHIVCIRVDLLIFKGRRTYYGGFDIEKEGDGAVLLTGHGAVGKESRGSSYLRPMKIVLGPAIFLSFVLLGPPASFSHEDRFAWRTLGILLWMIVWWLTECVDLTLTALLPIALFPLSSVQTVSVVCQSYFTPLIFLMASGFVLGGALEKYNIHHMCGLKILSLKAVNHRGDLVVLAIMLPCFLLSAGMRYYD